MNEKSKKVSELMLEDIKKISGEDPSLFVETDGNKNEVSANDNEAGNDIRTQTTGMAENNNSETPIENANANEESQSATDKVEKRGRHKLDCNCPKCEARRTGNATSDADKKAKGKDASGNLVNELSKYKTVNPNTITSNGQPAPTPDANKVDLSKYISGALLLICMDAIFPNFILLIAGFIDAKYKRIKSAARKKLKMTNEEKEELEPLADEIIKVIFGMVHPAVAFLVATAIIYAGKMFTLEDTDFNEPTQKTKTNERKRK